MKKVTTMLCAMLLAATALPICGAEHSKRVSYPAWYAPRLLGGVHDAYDRLGVLLNSGDAPVPTVALNSDQYTTIDGYSLRRADADKFGFTLVYTRGPAAQAPQLNWTWGGARTNPGPTLSSDIVIHYEYANMLYFVGDVSKTRQFKPACLDYLVFRATTDNGHLCFDTMSELADFADALSTLIVASGHEASYTSGIFLEQLPEKERQKNKGCAYVNVLLMNSPPDKAGMKEGDVLVAIDGTPCSGPDSFGPYVRAQAQKNPGGAHVKVDVLRHDKPLSFEMDYPNVVARKAEILAEAQALEQSLQQAETGQAGEPANAAPNPQGLKLGLQVRAVSDADVIPYALPKARGIVVVDVLAGSLAEKMGFAPGDVIVEVNNSEVGDLGVFKAYVQSGAIKSFRVLRKGQSLTVTMPETM